MCLEACTNLDRIHTIVNLLIPLEYLMMLIILQVETRNTELKYVHKFRMNAVYSLDENQEYTKMLIFTSIWSSLNVLISGIKCFCSMLTEKVFGIC